MNEYYSIACDHVEKSKFISESSPTKKTRIIQGHLMPIRDLDEGNMRNGYLEDQDIIEREFGQK